jgi:hypothetical protein
MFKILPVGLATFGGVVWLVYLIWAKGKFDQIKKDFTDPLFLGTLGIAFIIMFFTNDSNPFRSQEANKHAFLAAIAAYFGNLNMWFAAFLMGGALIYYTWDKEQAKKMEIQWGMDPQPKYHHPAKEKYIGQGWNKEKQGVS